MVTVRDMQSDAEAYGKAAPEHFEWQTKGAYVGDQERALVAAAFLPLSGRVLDLGCGEGATLFHLGEPEGGGDCLLSAGTWRQ